MENRDILIPFIWLDTHSKLQYHISVNNHSHIPPAQSEDQFLTAFRMVVVSRSPQLSSVFYNIILQKDKTTTIGSLYNTTN